MSLRYSNGAIIKPGFNPVLVPGAPTIGAVTGGNAQVIVAFTAPIDTGGSAITSYQVVSSPGSVVATGASSPITVTGLTNDTAYTFRVAAVNSYGAGTFSAASASATPTSAGQQEFTTAGTFTWVAPTGVTSVSVVAIGGGGGGGKGFLGCCAFGGNAAGGGGLGYKNNITVVPGNSYTVVVGAGGVGTSSAFATTSGSASYFCSTGLVRGGPGGAGGGNRTGDGGGNGGTGGSCQPSSGGGGGAGGYAGNGGNGGNASAGATGSGGGGGGGGSSSCSSHAGGAGGGVGLLGQGSSGSGGARGVSTAVGVGGGGGSGGTSGAGGGSGGLGKLGGSYGGGGSGGNLFCAGGNGGVGAVRIIWPGNTRSFPSTNTGNL